MDTSKIDMKLELELLNKLPYAITVHDNFDTIVYENKTALDLFGIRTDNICTSRWCHHSDYISNSCPLCPGKFSKADKQKHKVFRKLIDSSQRIRYLEFESVPIFTKEQNSTDGYIEIVRDVTEGELTKVKNLQSQLQGDSERYYSIMKYGLSGGEMIFSDELFFTDNRREFLMKLSGFAFIGVMQNNFDRIGLYGPLPVLDEKNYEMFVFAFTVKDHSIIDPRKNQNELILILILFERNNKIVTINRQLINDLISSYVLKLQTIEEITEEWMKLIKIEINKLIDSPV